MDNETLVLRIKEGDKEKYADLWNQVERFVAQRAARRMSVTGANAWAEFDDLYQSGFLAMVEAVETYDPGRGMGFLGWLKYYLVTAFNDALGLRTERQRNEPLHVAASLDAPLNESDADGTLLDCIPDVHADQSMEQAESRIWCEQLHDTLERAISQLSDNDADILRLHYYHGQSLQRISEIQGRTSAEVYDRHKRSLKKLRTGTRSAGLRQYIELRTPYYAHINPTKFNATHTSAVELAVIHREELWSRL